MSRPVLNARLLPLSAVMVVVLVLLVSCGPSTATLQITLKNEEGAALADVTVTVQEKSAKTDSKGQATLRGVVPGEVTISFAGGEYAGERTATVKAGNNALSYELQSNAFSVRPMSDITRMRIRVRQSDNEAAVTEGTFVRGEGVHWRMADGSEVISLFDVLYVKPSGQGWQRVQTGASGQLLAEAIAGMANQMLGEIQAFDARVMDTAVQARWIDRAEANGYDCRVFEVSWSSDSQSGTYQIYVIASGEHQGFATRYSWDVSGGGGVLMIFDIYDLNGDYDVTAPM